MRSWPKGLLILIYTDMLKIKNKTKEYFEQFVKDIWAIYEKYNADDAMKKKKSIFRD